MTTGAYVSHCDYEGCSMGSFQYDCPVCGLHSADYDVWFTEDSVIRDGRPHEFSCEVCKAALCARYASEKLTIRVETIHPSPSEMAK